MKTWERRLNDAKKKHRPKHRDWACDGFATRRVREFEALAVLDSSNQLASNRGIAKLNCSELSVERFVEEFEKPYRPCIIEGIPQMQNWGAVTSWTFPQLKKRFSDRLFKCGEDDDGYKIKHKMKYYLQYMKHNIDDSPLYIFDGAFDNDVHAKSMLNDYKVPPFFTDDLFSLVGERRRPPYRWFLMGPKRSGSEVHLDPLGTSAWNTILTGRKRWVLFPPSVPRSVCKGLDVIKKGEDDEAINYFVDILPRIREKYGAQYPIIELIQEPNETIFVPGGWWHGVLNLEDTVAVTQNFCSYSNFDAVWRKTRGGRKKMAVKMLSKLHELHPTLGRRAEELNEQDEFTMYSADAKKTNETGNDKSDNKNSSDGSKSSTGTVNTSSTKRSIDEISVTSSKHSKVQFSFSSASSTSACVSPTAAPFVDTISSKKEKGRSSSSTSSNKKHKDSSKHKKKHSSNSSSNKKESKEKKKGKNTSSSTVSSDAEEDSSRKLKKRKTSTS